MSPDRPHAAALRAIAERRVSIVKLEPTDAIVLVQDGDHMWTVRFDEGWLCECGHVGPGRCWHLIASMLVVRRPVAA